MIVLLLAAVVAQANATTTIALDAGRVVRLLSRDDGQSAIVSEEGDPFFARLSSMDYQTRLQMPLDEKSAQQAPALLKKNYRDAVVDWNASEKEALASACRSVAAQADRWSPGLIPQDWTFVKTNGADEFGAAYTRGRAIILPAQKLAGDFTQPAVQANLARLVAHETAHVFTRNHPQARDRLYRRLGFRHVGPVELGPWLEARRITNPDGPTFEYTLRVTFPDLGEGDGVLVTYAKSDRYHPNQGRRLFDYLRFQLFPVEKKGNHYQVTDGVNPKGYDVKSLPTFWRQISENTQYVIHPDEIVADNLAILHTRHRQPEKTIPDPQLLLDLGKLVRAK